MPAVQDHKRALNGGGGFKTGGVDGYAPAPCVTPKLHWAIKAMCIRTVEKMAEMEMLYVGILSMGMM